MKKPILYLFIIMLLGSCKEEPSEDVISKSYPILLEIEQLRSDLPEAKRASTFSSADSLLNRFGVLYYLLFDANGKYVHQKKQLKGDESFGQISDELKVGQYTAVLVSCTGDMTVGSSLTTLATSKVRSTANSGDIYYKKLSLNVTEKGIKQSVLLDRIIGCVQLTVTDRIPDNVARVELEIENETPFFNLISDGVEVANTEARSVKVDINDSNRNSLSLSLLVLNDKLPITMNLKVFDASNAVLKTKKITGVINIRGQKVSVQGRLSDLMSTGLTIGYNDTWSSDSTIVYF